MLDNQLVKITNIFDPSKKEIITFPCTPGTRVRDFVSLANLGSNVAILVNGEETKDLSRLVMPGDIVCILPILHGDDVGKVVLMLAIVVAAWYFPPLLISSPFWAGVASVAIVTAGGLLINSMFPPPALPSLGQGSLLAGSKIDDSPTYGLNAGQNTFKEGLPLPVIYGEVKSYPQVINFYIQIDSEGNQWAHWLLCCGEGLIN